MKHAEKNLKWKNKNGEVFFKNEDKYTEIPTLPRTKRSLLGATSYLSASTSERQPSTEIYATTKTMKF